jgi:biopolymer transport protein ExbD
MNFRPRPKEEPEINLIPFIDVLLVMLIFLMLSTTYSKFTELQLKLPVADVEAQRDYPKEVLVSSAARATTASTSCPWPGAAWRPWPAH